MTSQIIPAEAVRAAFIAIYERDHIGGVGSADIRRALEAAAPYMIPAQAVEAALLSAADALEMQPPMLRAQYVATLRLYAAEPWRLTTCPSECAAGHPGREHGATK